MEWDWHGAPQILAWRRPTWQAFSSGEHWSKFTTSDGLRFTRDDHGYTRIKRILREALPRERFGELNWNRIHPSDASNPGRTCVRNCSVIPRAHSVNSRAHPCPSVVHFTSRGSQRGWRRATRAPSSSRHQNHIGIRNRVARPDQTHRLRHPFLEFHVRLESDRDIAEGFGEPRLHAGGIV